MNRKRIRKMVIKGIRQFGDPYYQGFAAQIAFFIMLSLVPTLILAGQILSYLNISMTDVLSYWINRSHMGNLQRNILDNLQGIINSVSGKNIKGKQTSLPLLNDIILIALALWSASRAQFSLMRIANYTYSEGRTTGNFFRERWRSLGTMFLTICSLTFVVIVLVYGKLILSLLFQGLFKGSLKQQVITTLWTFLRWPLAAVLYFFIVLFDYYVLPIRKMPLKDHIPGSIAAAAAMVIITVFYSVYVQFLANYALIYSSMASIVALLFWFYFLSWVLVLGVLFNKVWLDTRSAARPKNVIPTR